MSTHPSVYTQRPVSQEGFSDNLLPLSTYRTVKGVGSGIRLPRLEFLACYLPV